MDIPTIDLAPLNPHDPASSLWNYKKNTAARFSMAYEAFDALYKHQIQPKKLLNCRPVINKKRKDSDQDYEATLKKEYLVQYEALVIKKWALPLLRQIKDVTIYEKKDMSRRNF